MHLGASQNQEACYILTKVFSNVFPLRVDPSDIYGAHIRLQEYIEQYMAGELRRGGSSSTDIDEDTAAEEDEPGDGASDLEDLCRWLDDQESSAASSGSEGPGSPAPVVKCKQAFVASTGCPRCFNPPSSCSLYA